jgi:hypothetical protein
MRADAITAGIDQCHQDCADAQCRNGTAAAQAHAGRPHERKRADRLGHILAQNVWRFGERAFSVELIQPDGHGVQLWRLSGPKSSTLTAIQGSC